MPLYHIISNFFFYSPLLGAGGAKVQFESKVRTPNQDKKISGQNQTESRFKDLLEEDIET